MLLARRLCEAGCGFVTVSDCGWDMHANDNSPSNMAGLPPMAGQVDHAVAAFIEDVHERGLSDKILLVVTGEMGRTPRLQQERRPRPLRQPDDAAPRRRRPEDGPGDRPIGPHRRNPATERYTPSNTCWRR